MALQRWPCPHRPPPQGGPGDRPIGITPILYALFLRTYGDIVDGWDAERMHFWEDAVKGSSALQAALKRRLFDECSVALGFDTAAI